MPKVRSLAWMFGEIVALVAAARADGAARHAHRACVDGLVGAAARRACRANRAAPGARVRARSLRCADGVEQVAHQVFGGVRARAGDAETRAAALHGHAHAVLDEAQVFVERPAQVREPRVVRRHEIEFAGGFDWGGGGHQANHSTASGDRVAGVDAGETAAQALRQRLDDGHVDELADEAAPGPAKFTQRLFSVLPASSCASFFDGRSTSTRCVLPTIDLADGARLFVELRLQAREALLLDLERHVVRQRGRGRARDAGCR